MASSEELVLGVERFLVWERLFLLLVALGVLKELEFSLQVVWLQLELKVERIGVFVNPFVGVVRISFLLIWALAFEQVLVIRALAFELELVVEALAFELGLVVEVEAARTIVIIDPTWPFASCIIAVVTSWNRLLGFELEQVCFRIGQLPRWLRLREDLWGKFTVIEPRRYYFLLSLGSLRGPR